MFLQIRPSVVINSRNIESISVQERIKDTTEAPDAVVAELWVQMISGLSYKVTREYDDAVRDFLFKNPAFSGASAGRSNILRAEPQ